MLLDELCFVCINSLFSFEDTILSTGQWSARGCSRNATLSNTSVSVCECYRLTYFAILVSEPPRDLSEPTMVISWTVLGYVCTSVSLVAMALTITTLALLP